MGLRVWDFDSRVSLMQLVSSPQSPKLCQNFILKRLTPEDTDHSDREVW